MKNLILEIERVQLIHKKCKAEEKFCGECLDIKDFVMLNDIASLFSFQKMKLFEFINTNSIHNAESENGEIFICISSFLAYIQTQNKQMKPIKLISSTKT